MSLQREKLYTCIKANLCFYKFDRTTEIKSEKLHLINRYVNPNRTHYYHYPEQFCFQMLPISSSINLTKWGLKHLTSLTPVEYANHNLLCLVTMCPLELTYLLSVSYLLCLVTMCPLELTYLLSVSDLLCLVTMCPLELTYLLSVSYLSRHER
jgi:hypothetical protein